jgi:periplasmic protein TonB
MKLRLNFNLIFLLIFFFSLFFLMVSETKPKNLVPGEEEYLVAVDKMPAPVGGVDAIMKKINYPSAAQKIGIQGKVYVLIYINEKGEVDDVKVVKGIGAGCDEEAANTIKRSKFTPGMNNGVAVKTKFSLAITFKMS